ncbi:hypothetical protein GF337_16530 [candidate division KSB1 bacterium]|nr:hypothetical protein [candidate division KSB1 bacterium]
MIIFRQYLSALLTCIFLPVSMSLAQQNEFEQYIVQHQYPEMRKTNLDSAGVSDQEFFHSPKDTVSKVKHNIIPVIAFGFTGLFIGTAIGAEIDPTTGTLEFYSNGKAIGAVIGTVVGVSVGYHLGEEEITDE